MISTSGNFKTQVAMQTAAVRVDDPGPAATVLSQGSAGTTQADAGELNTGNRTISSTTASKFWVRFGVAYWIDTGQSSTPAQGDVSLQVSFQGCGTPVGAHTFQARTDTTVEQFEPITDWFPAFQVDKVKAAIIVAGVEGSNFQSRLVFQTADTSKDAPSAWDPTPFTETTPYEGGTSAQILGADEICPGELTPNPAVSAMWMRLGIGYSLSTGSAMAQATISTVTAVRKS